MGNAGNKRASAFKRVNTADKRSDTYKEKKLVIKVGRGKSARRSGVLANTQKHN